MRVDDIMVTGLPRRGTSSFILQPSCLPKADVILPERAAGDRHQATCQSRTTGRVVARVLVLLPSCSISDRNRIYRMGSSYFDL